MSTVWVLRSNGGSLLGSFSLNPSSDLSMDDESFFPTSFFFDMSTGNSTSTVNITIGNEHNQTALSCRDMNDELVGVVIIQLAGEYLMLEMGACYLITRIFHSQFNQCLQ